jgi:hypothetical protein
VCRFARRALLGPFSRNAVMWLRERLDHRAGPGELRERAALLGEAAPPTAGAMVPVAPGCPGCPYRAVSRDFPNLPGLGRKEAVQGVALTESR